jgi:hypothetical protein
MTLTQQNKDEGYSEHIIEALTTIGNEPRVIKMCEPNIALPGTLHEWMVLRVLTALDIFQKVLSTYKEEIDGKSETEQVKET